MTLDLTRRKFLQGFMATAGIVAVAPQLLVAAEPVVLPVTRQAVRSEFGDFWLCLDREWRFVGKIHAVQMTREEPIFFTGEGGWRDALPTFRNQYIDMSLTADPVGAHLAHEAWSYGGYVASCIGTKEGQFTCERSLVTSSQYCAGAADKFVEHLISMDCAGPIELQMLEAA